MVDTQRFAIWHPPMPAEVKKPAPAPIIPEQPQALSRNIENLVENFRWNDGFNSANPTPIPASRPRIPSVSYNRPSVAPQPIHLTPHLNKPGEDDSESSSDEEAVKIPPMATRKFSSSSPPKPMLGSTPVNNNLSNGRPKPTDRVSFALPKEIPKENESNLSQTRTKPIEKRMNQGPKAISKQPTPPSALFPELPKQAPGLKKPAGLTEANKDPISAPIPPSRNPPPIESRRITPPDSKFTAQRMQEIPRPIPAPAPSLASSQISRQPLVPANDQGFVTHNGFTSLDTFLIQLQDEAFDSMKLSMMEASIRQFHLIAADADVQLTRKLCSIKAANVGERRRALIEEHKQFMEAQASSLLTDMSALHDQLKEQQQTTPGRGLFDIAVDEDGWERPLPPSTVPWKSTPPPNQPKPSGSWKPSSSPPKTVEVPKPQPPPPKPNLEPELAMPSFWKPAWDADLTEPPTPQVPPISRLVTIEDVPDEGGVPEPMAPKNAKPAPAPAQQPISMKNQVPNVADEPAPVWGQPWRKGKPPVSNTSPNQTAKPGQASPPPPPVVEKPPTTPPVTAPILEPTPAPAPTPSQAQTKPKSAKQLRAEKNRKGKNKAAATAFKEDIVEEQEEVPMPPPQQIQPPAPAPQQPGLDAAIDSMVSTGNFRTTLEQINWAWR